MRKAVVEQVTGKVINVIEIEKGAEWTPPEGCILKAGGEIGEVWDGRNFVHLEVTPSEPEISVIDQLKIEIEALRTKLGVK